jgi:hypothetical protein
MRSKADLETFIGRISKLRLDCYAFSFRSLSIRQQRVVRINFNVEFISNSELLDLDVSYVNFANGAITRHLQTVPV